MSEKWREYYSDYEIKKIQSLLLESLKVFIEICEKLDIEFMLYGGTLLGAVKYKGFVPWDDDIDLALLRKDYDKLIKFGPALLPKEYEILHPSINKATPFPYVKFIRKDIRFAEYHTHKLKIHGIYFDIYPIDNLPDDDKLLYKEHKKFQTIVRLFSLRQSKYLYHPVNSLNDVFKAIIKTSIHFVLRLIPHRYFVNKMYKIMTKYNDITTKRQGNYFYPKPVNYFYGIYPMKKLLFEGFELKIPNGYEINLFNRYGDISKLPPEENRIGHKPYILEI